MISEGKDNRDVQDMAQNQKLSMEQIEEMKFSGVEGTSIVEALVQNSETFERKTEFAQEKYLSKKQQKYCTTFTALRPTSASICEAQFDWFAVKTSFLRVDNLAMILSLANVGPYRRVLVVDNCMGMLVGAVAERVGGFGDIVLTYFGKKTPKLEALRRFRPCLQESIIQLPFHDLERVRKEFQSTQTATLSERSTAVDDGPEFLSFVKKGSIPSESLRRWLQLGFDSCILSDWKVHPSVLIQAALPLLAPSSPFVVYSGGITSLIQCQEMLRKRQDVVMVELQELTWREYQVLPGRTRPDMEAKISGGYILSGIKVRSSDFEECIEDLKVQEDSLTYKKPRNDDAVINS